MSEGLEGKSATLRLMCKWDTYTPRVDRNVSSGIQSHSINMASRTCIDATDNRK